MTEETTIDWSTGMRLMAGDMFLGLYQPSPETTGYWDGVRRHEFLLKHCLRCDGCHHPRRILCPDCNEAVSAWKPAKGTGKLHSYSEVHRATGVFAKSTPYTVGIVELDEGVPLFARIFGEPGIDVPVEVDFRVLEQGALLPVFVVKTAP